MPLFLLATFPSPEYDACLSGHRARQKSVCHPRLGQALLYHHHHSHHYQDNLHRCHHHHHQLLITIINIVNIIINTKFHTGQGPVCHPRLGQAPHTCLSGHPDDKEHWSTFFSQSWTKDATLVVPIFYPPLQILPSNITN